MKGNKREMCGLNVITFNIFPVLFLGRKDIMFRGILMGVRKKLSKVLKQ